MVFEFYSISSHVAPLISFLTLSRQTARYPLLSHKQNRDAIVSGILHLSIPPGMFFPQHPLALLITSFRFVLGAIFSQRTTLTHYNTIHVLAFYFSYRTHHHY